METVRRGKGLEEGEFCWREGAVERDPGEGGMGGGGPGWEGAVGAPRGEPQEPSWPGVLP